MSQMISARITYTKQGFIKFIGHLDTTRAISRALRHAGLPIKYSQGFNPHVKCAFGPALPLGFSSDCEYVDVELTQLMDETEFQQRLQPCLPQGITVGNVAVRAFRPTALCKAIDHIHYRITLPEHFSKTADEITQVLETEPQGEDAKKAKRMQQYIESVTCIPGLNQTCVYDFIMKDANKNAPSVTKMFLILFGIDIFAIDGVRRHRVTQNSTRMNL